MQNPDALRNAYNQLQAFAKDSLDVLDDTSKLNLQNHLKDLAQAINDIGPPGEPKSELGNFAGLTDSLMVIDNILVPEVVDDAGNILFSKEKVAISQDKGYVVAKYENSGIYLDLAIDPKVIKPLISPEGAPKNGVGYGREQNNPGEHH